MPPSTVNLKEKEVKVKTIRLSVTFSVKKYKLEIGYKDLDDKCEYIEESIVNETEKTLVLSDEAMLMTDLLLPLLEDTPKWYYKMLSLSLMSGCIVGNA